MKVLVTGGCGFIGSNFIKYLLTDDEVDSDISVVNVDKMTYAGQGKNLDHMGLDDDRYRFHKADITDRVAIDEIMVEERPNLVVNFAAESHVDRSLENPNQFRETNLYGVINLLSAIKYLRLTRDSNGVERFLQISTDEVYGSLNVDEKSWTEESEVNPRNPYSETKAAAERNVLDWDENHGISSVITRSSNNYGAYQFPEKLLPRFTTKLIDGKKVPLMWSIDNPGLNIRDWLHVEDNCRAIYHVLMNGENGEIYNIPGNNERTNIEITKMLLEMFGYSDEVIENDSMIEKVDHRQSHDFRYSTDGSKLEGIGFKHRHIDLREGLEETVQWYRENEDWWRPLLTE